MILADTSIWIDHLRQSDPGLSNLLESNQIICHPMIIGELACGQLKNRQEVLKLLGRLPEATPASHEEVVYFIGENDLMGIGIGFIDAHLLASTALTESAVIWTRDKRLHNTASALGLT